jgi:hypothetical protein
MATHINALKVARIPVFYKAESVILPNKIGFEIINFSRSPQKGNLPK